MINQLSELLQIVVVDQQVVSALDMFYDVFTIDMIGYGLALLWPQHSYIFFYVLSLAGCVVRCMCSE